MLLIKLLSLFITFFALVSALPADSRSPGRTITNAERIRRHMPLNKPAALFSPDRIRTARDATTSPSLTYQSYLQARKVSDDSVVGYVGYRTSGTSGYQIVPAGSTSALFLSYSGFAASDSKIGYIAGGTTQLLGLMSQTTTTSVLVGYQSTSTATGIKVWNWDDPHGRVTAAEIRKNVRTTDRIYKSASSVFPSFIQTGTAAPSGYFEIYLESPTKIWVGYGYVARF
ncbi:uncharacterized protein MKK02DRAFT_29313 [Dioszegia hungarica]|uniref:Uncharacterized protein n=1 Tax=Dioszegia hungarica TaxID=4972 RepID=A0AA38LXZ1_9TREE|nr:uncharacterized protein MKK02DRAFT_29313 [Dioszegia hungarica]KAI9639208.1 hypothetical protein MKK02DRAFT_29313 [Dioszegia hungarica]